MREAHWYRPPGERRPADPPPAPAGERPGTTSTNRPLHLVPTLPAGSDLGLGTPAASRIVSYWTGGKDCYEIDRDLADDMAKENPGLPASFHNQARFRTQAALRLVTECGVRQFLDIGSGMPRTAAVQQPSLHEIVQDQYDTSRVMYCDNDLIASAHSRALLETAGRDGVRFLALDARSPMDILQGAAGFLDLQQPVAATLFSLLHHLDARDAHQLVRTLVDQLPSGSILALSHLTGDIAPDEMQRAVKVAEDAGLIYSVRNRSQIERFFAGLDLLEPGILPLATWLDHYWSGDQATRDLTGAPASVYADVEAQFYVGVGRKQ